MEGVSIPRSAETECIADARSTSKALFNIIHCLDGRVLKPEMLDTLPEIQARASLADLVRINRDWGGYSTLRQLLGPS